MWNAELHYNLIYPDFYAFTPIFTLAGFVVSDGFLFAKRYRLLLQIIVGQAGANLVAKTNNRTSGNEWKRFEKTQGNG